eukprot:COSAG04_NODE_4232_length_2220_cov_1.747289_1_plen_35_part_10
MKSALALVLAGLASAAPNNHSRRLQTGGQCAYLDG